MPKRKRDGDGGDQQAVSHSDSVPKGAQHQRVQHKLAQGAVKLGHAFKIAKGFERQKLGRRQKTVKAAKDVTGERRIESEIAALKTLDTTALGKHHLSKTLGKIKSAAASPVLASEIASLPVIPHDAATLNVVARLCKSTPVQAALPEALQEVQRAAGIPIENVTPVKKKRARAKDFEEDAKQPTVKARPVDVKSERSTGTREAPLAERVSLQDQDEASDDEFGGYEDRLASSDDDDRNAWVSNRNLDDEDAEMFSEGYLSGDDEWVSNQYLDDDGIPVFADEEMREHWTKHGQSSNKDKSDMTVNGEATRNEDSAPGYYDPSKDLALSEVSISRSPSPEPQKAAKVAAKPKASSFVPSLSLGGYISGSGSDPESDIDVEPAPKNRRGQRARQKIWEQKFGAGAKHVVKSQNDPNKGWDPKRGATDSARGRGNSGGRGRGGAPVGRPAGGRSFPQAYGENRPAAPPKKHKDDDGPLHPSWEAAKLAKEKKSAPIAFVGKKTTFE
nr:hypothetical protein B0A51_03169 [Rachicladosporium sp. CCFEE 5018]